MKPFLKKLLLFLSPFLLIVVLIMLIDPYNLINISHIISDETKTKCLERSLEVAPRGYALWNIIEYKKNPTSNIILGDSKLLGADTSYLRKYLTNKTTNLSIPGASYQTLTDIFWMAAKTTRLKNVIFQTSFISDNELDKISLFQSAMDLIEKPYKYFLDRKYLEDSFFVLYYSINKDDCLVNWRLNIDEDLWSRSQKWINSIIMKDGFKYSKDYLPELKKISEYCEKENINILFVIPPNYYEMYSIIKNAGFENDYQQFKNDIKSLGNSLDLDKGLQISYKKSYFDDYLHLKPSFTDSIFNLIFTYTQNADFND